MDKDSLSLLESRVSVTDTSGRGEARDRQFGGLDDPLLVLPDQFFSAQGLNRASHVEGERRLLGAILEDAFNCFRKFVLARDRRPRELFKQTEEWFLNEESAAPITFEYICETNGMDADSIRAALRTWRDAQVAAAGLKAESLKAAEPESNPGAWDEPELRRASGE